MTLHYRCFSDKNLRQAVDKLDSPDYNHSADRTYTALLGSMMSVVPAKCCQTMRRGDGIGRHSGLKIRFPYQGSAGSSPALGIAQRSCAGDRE